MGLFQNIKSMFHFQLKISDEPDHPIPFGMKMSWLAIKADDPQVVMEQLGLNNGEVCNWKSAFQYFDRSHYEKVFVTPCFDGYVLILNVPSLLDDPHQLNKIALQFEEVQYFASMRIVDLLKYEKSKPHRLCLGDTLRMFLYLKKCSPILNYQNMIML